MLPASQLLAHVLERHPRMRGVSWILNLPGFLLIAILLDVWLQPRLPLLTSSYVLAGIGSSLIVSSIGGPLLTALGPEKIEQEFIQLRVMRTAIFLWNKLPLEYLDHPEILQIQKEAAAKAKGISTQARGNVLATTLWSIFTGLLACVSLPWTSSLPTLRWACLVVPIYFALRAIFREHWNFRAMQVLNEALPALEKRLQKTRTRSEAPPG